MADIHKAMIEILSKLGAIGREQRNKQQGFMYRGIDDIYNAINPLFAEHGVYTLPNVLSEETTERQAKSGGTLFHVKLVVEYTFFAADGSNVSATVLGEGMDSGDKAGNKAMSIAHKYALTQAFTIKTMELADPDSETHEPQYNKPDTSAPGPQDFQPEYNARHENELVSLSEYRIPVGSKYRDKTLGSVPANEIRSFVQWIKSPAGKSYCYQGNVLKPAYREFLNKAERFLEIT